MDEYFSKVETVIPFGCQFQQERKSMIGIKGLILQVVGLIQNS